ncbi:protein CLEC16A-like [Elysia marginata]|uniref:Protein CLEC16A-like n=1 Tax=Elysia marginata TaxID=1093978 RepID=A0AAV4IW32_9GAST|nr:protein CLEC16A-like [Elysia marginata]
MFHKQKSWLSGTLWKPKNPHSLEHLKFLYNLLCKNQTVTEQNRSLLVETLRSISEILIWGDQNDSSVFDFFLEKNMLSFFLRYLQQKFGRYICVQLLQTLNILFENIRNETSLYYLLSNNHVNSIIVHKFDFSDEEVMAYYISFLKTLSLKLNKHTIHFFYNEIPAKFQPKANGYQHTNDFALYTEAIKFFNHSESMVRIAVRTITLNVFKVDDKAMLSYIRDRTAAPYFSNLVWFIGNHILDLDACVRHDHDHRSRDRLADLVAEHLDHLHYLNDIFLIHIDTLNQVLTDKLINRLLVPLYIYSLTKRKRLPDEADDRKHVSCVVSLFLLSQVFLIIHYSPLMQQLAQVIFQGDVALSQPAGIGHRASPKMGIREFRPPRESLEKTLENTKPKRNYDHTQQETSGSKVKQSQEGSGSVSLEQAVAASATAAALAADAMSTPSTEGALSPSSEVCSGDTELSSPTQNSTDEEKLLGRTYQRLAPTRSNPPTTESLQLSFSLDNRPYLEAIFNALECSENDYSALFALCLLYAMGQSRGISQSLLDSVLMPTDRSESKENYNLYLVERLIRLIELGCQAGSKVRIATLEMSIKLLRQLVVKDRRSFLQDRHLACVENARECCTQLLRNFYKSEEIFLDMFEDEYREMKTRPLNVEYLMQDASILLPPTGTPLTGIDFNKRLPCGEVERARRAIRVFFLVRDLSLCLMQEKETQLPLTKEQMCIKEEDVLDLNNSDLIACTVVTRESRRQERRFLVIDPVQLILVEPDSKRLGWGVVKFVGYLQDVEVSGDKDDSRLLHVVVHRPQASVHAKPLPLLSARFVFDDHIRCMAAKQRLIKGRQKARQQKMATVERLLDISHNSTSSVTDRGHFTRGGPIPGRSHPVRVERSSSGGSQSSQAASNNGSHSPSPSPTPSVSVPPSSSVSSVSMQNSSSSSFASTVSGSSNRSGRKVTAEQRRLLQAKAAQRSRSRQEQQQQQQQQQQEQLDKQKEEKEIPESHEENQTLQQQQQENQASTPSLIAAKSEIDEVDDEVELAQDAASAEAFQSLNSLASSGFVSSSSNSPSANSSFSHSPVGGRRSSSAQDAGNSLNEIPMENLALSKEVVKPRNSFVPSSGGGEGNSSTVDSGSQSIKAPRGLARITGGIGGFVASRGSIFRFQRSASLSPNRIRRGSGRSETGQANTSLSISPGGVDLTRRLSVPIQCETDLASDDTVEVVVDARKGRVVTKVSTATQVGRPHSHSMPPDPSLLVRASGLSGPASTAAYFVAPNVGNTGNALPARRRCLSGPTPISPAPSLRLADGPALSLAAAMDEPSSGAPQLLATVTLKSTFQGPSPLCSGGGAVPKHYTVSSTAELKVNPSSAGGSGSGVGSGASASGLTAHRLKLHSLQQQGSVNEPTLRRAAAAVAYSAAAGPNAVSPETPSSDSALSSDASMMSVSSMGGGGGSDTSMDVDSDNGAGGGIHLPGVGTGGIAGRDGASGGCARSRQGSASQQLTQLAQMVQEHYPYKPAPPEGKHHHTG